MIHKNFFFFSDEACDCGCSCGCSDHDHDHHDEELGESIVTMVDEETGEEYQFTIVDDFDFEGEMYCVLLTREEEPEALIVKVVSDDEDNDYFMSLEDEEYDRVAAEYERILEETEFEDDETEE